MTGLAAFNFLRKTVCLSLILCVKSFKKSCKQISSLMCGKRQSFLLCSKKETSSKLLTIDPYHCSKSVKTFRNLDFKKVYTFRSSFLHDSQSSFQKNGKATDSVFDIILTDFIEAFDKVDHGLPLQTICIMGVQGRLFQVINPFVISRHQQACVGDSFQKPSCDQWSPTREHSKYPSLIHI